MAKGKQHNISFAIPAQEAELWKRLAAKEGRSVTMQIRMVMVAACQDAGLLEDATAPITPVIGSKPGTGLEEL